MQTMQAFLSVSKSSLVLCVLKAYEGLGLRDVTYNICQVKNLLSLFCHR